MENSTENKNEKPKIFNKLKILGIVLLVIGAILLIIGIILLITLINEGYYIYFVSGIMIFLGFGGVGTGVKFIKLSFAPNLGKAFIQTQRYIVVGSKDDLKETVDTSADIASGAIKKTVKAIKEGLKDTKFCKHCGAEIDANSVFCNKCGKEQ